MVHGMGAGLAMFALNIDSLASEPDRTVFALDLPGFGRSSRPSLGSEAEEVDERMVTALDRWRRGLGLSTLHLLGHSFGGYLSALYCLRYPDSVSSLILADPR